MKKTLESLRSEGNSSFRSGNFDDATKIYQKGLNMMEGRKLDADLVHMKSVFYSNQAVCRMKTHAPKEAVRLCNEAIKCDPLWEKPYVRRAECFKQIQTQFNDDVPEATADRQRATVIVTTDPETYKRANPSQRVFDNINTALLDANRNEIIFVEAGIYHLSPNEDFDWSATGVSLIGASITKSVISGVLKWESTVRGLIKRLTIAGTLVNNNYNLAIEDVWFKSSKSMETEELPLPYLWILYNAKVTLSFCFFQGDNLRSRGIWCRDLATLVMSNCWIDGHHRGVSVDNATCVMQNCTLSNCLSYAYQQDPRGDINRPPPGLPDEAIEASLEAVGLNDKDKKVRSELIGCYFVDNNKRLKCDYGQEAGDGPIREAVFSVGFSHAEAILENSYIRWTDPPFPVSLDDTPVEKYFINGVRHQGKRCPGRIKNCIFENFSYTPNTVVPGAGSAGLVIHSLLGFEVTNNKFSKCNVGISLNSGTKSIVKGNAITDCGQGIFVSRSSKPQVISNTMERCSLAAVAFHSAGAGHVSKNTLKECGGGFVIQDECFPTLENNIYVNCVEQPDMIIGPVDKKYPLGFYYTMESQIEADQVEKLSGKKTKLHDHKFICKAAKEKKFTKSMPRKQTKKLRICHCCAVASAEVMSCRGCKMTNYCSEACQRAHWKDHSKDCGFDFNKKNDTEKKKAPKGSKKAEAVTEIELD